MARPLNRYLRHEAGLGGRVRELAILVTARELDSQFEWAAHEPEALRQGISLHIIEIVQHRGDPSGLDDGDAIVIELGREIFGARNVASATFARALRHFGRRALVDLVALMGNYAGTAALLATFDMQLDQDQRPLLPMPYGGAAPDDATGRLSRGPIRMNSSGMVPSGIGQPVRRKEDFRLLTGKGSFGDDLFLPGSVHAAMVPSPHAHARIGSVDKKAALAAPGVLAVLTGVDYVADGLGPIPHGAGLMGPPDGAAARF